MSVHLQAQKAALAEESAAETRSKRSQGRAIGLRQRAVLVNMVWYFLATIGANKQQEQRQEAGRSSHYTVSLLASSPQIPYKPANIELLVRDSTVLFQSPPSRPASHASRAHRRSPRHPARCVQPSAFKGKACTGGCRTVFGRGQQARRESPTRRARGAGLGSAHRL